MKKKILTLLSLSLLLARLSAISFDEIVASAESNNATYKNQMLSYEKGLLSLEKMDLEDSSSITLSLQADPILKSTSISSYASEIGAHEYGISLTPSVNVALKDGKTQLSASMPYLVDYNGKANIMSPTLGAGYLFDFSEYDDDVLNDINYAISKYTTEYTYRSAQIALKKNVINAISNILSVEMNIKDARKKIKDTETTLDEYKKLSSFSESSVAYRSVINALESYNSLLKTYEDSLSVAKASYENITGIEWSELDSIPEPALAIAPLAGGNTSVLIDSLKVQQKEEIYKKAEKDYSIDLLAVDAKASSLINVVDNTTGSLTLSGGLEYTGDNWSVSAKPSGTWAFESAASYTFTPSLTLAASWTNNTKIKSIELDKSDKRLDITSAENDYSAALTMYQIEAQQYSSKIMSWNLKRAQKDSNLSYLEAVLENKRALFDAGIATASEVETAEFNLESARDEYNIMLLEGLSLQCDLEVFAL